MRGFGNAPRRSDSPDGGGLIVCSAHVCCRRSCSSKHYPTLVSTLEWELKAWFSSKPMVRRRSFVIVSQPSRIKTNWCLQMFCGNMESIHLRLRIFLVFWYVRVYIYNVCVCVAVYIYTPRKLCVCVCMRVCVCVCPVSNSYSRGCSTQHVYLSATT